MIQEIDFNILNGIQDIFRCGFLDWLMPVISLIGGGYVWCIFGIIALFIKKLRFNGITVITAFTITILFTEFIIKPLFLRERPFEINTEHVLLISEPFGSSFPSAHTSSSFGAAIQFFGIKRWAGITAMIAASLVAFSRLYLYVHFPSDVLTGIVIGVIIGITVTVAGEKIRTHIQLKERTE